MASRSGASVPIAICNTKLADPRVVLDLQDLYDNAPCGYHSVDASGLILRMNLTELGWLGMTHEEVVGRLKIGQLMSERSCAQYTEAVQAVFRGGGPIEIEVELVRRDASMFDAFLRIAAVRDERGGFVHTRATVIDISARKRAENDARLYAAQLQAISKRVVEIQEAERRNIAAELHDRLGQDLAAVNVNLHILKEFLPAEKQAAAGRRLDDSIALVDRAVETVRDVAGGLRPLILDDYGLVVALRSYAGEFAARTALQVSVLADTDIPRLAHETELALFRVAQEALNNVLKHAKATKVDVMLDLDGDDVSLTIGDDGCGCDAASRPKSAGKGLGLLIMQERLRSVNGSLQMSSRSSRGTSLVARVRTTP